MSHTPNRKKKLIVSYKNLSEELKALFNESYPEGYKDYMQKTLKPDGTPIFVVPMMTEDTEYMVKFDVKIDTGIAEDDIEKDLFDEDKMGDDNFTDPTEMEKDYDNPDHTERVLKHGAYEDMMEEMGGKGKKRHSSEMSSEELEAVLGEDDEDELDSYTGEKDIDYEEEDEDEPSDEDIMNMDIDIEAMEREEVEKNNEAKGKSKTKTNTKAAAKPATKADPKAAAKPTAKAASKPGAKTAAKPTAKAATKATPKATAKKK